MNGRSVWTSFFENNSLDEPKKMVPRKNSIFFKKWLKRQNGDQRTKYNLPPFPDCKMCPSFNRFKRFKKERRLFDCINHNLTFFYCFEFHSIIIANNGRPLDLALSCADRLSFYTTTFFILVKQVVVNNKYNYMLIKITAIEVPCKYPTN